MAPKITLVDDDQNILTSVSMALEAEGFEVTTYPDGSAALEMTISTVMQAMTPYQVVRVMITYAAMLVMM